MTDILCTDDKHRVKLLMYPGIEGSDYINATFLDVSVLLYATVKQLVHLYSRAIIKETSTL